MAAADKILLGHGVVAVDTIPIGLTRGGSAFGIEREIRSIEADGDFGPVKGRQVVDSEIATLKINALELFTAANMVKYYPATAITTGTTEDVWNGTLQILESDYHAITWTGKTKDGKSIVIELENAINMSKIEWKLEDKNEVVPEIEYTACYDEATRSTPPWSIKFGK